MASLVIAGCGTVSSQRVQVSLNLWVRYVTVRNNIFSGTGSTNSYTAINVGQRGVEPIPLGVRIYNNTIYKMDDTGGAQYEERTAVQVNELAEKIIIRNNLVQFSLGVTVRNLIDSDAIDVVEDHNLLTLDAGLVDPGNLDYLLKDFALSQTSVARNQGITVPVFDDFAGNIRPFNGTCDLGAFEWN